MNGRTNNDDDVQITQYSPSSCKRECHMRVECKAWTFDSNRTCFLGTGSSIHNSKVFRRWETGLVESDETLRHQPQPFSEPSITRGILDEWASRILEETPMLRYDLETHQRGHCTQNAECHCFPPYRGLKCELTDVETKKGYRAMIEYLTSNEAHDIDDLTESLDSIWKRFNRYHDYPVVIFHDGLELANRIKIVQASKNRVWFHFVDDFMRLPETITRSSAQMHQLDNSKFSIGYRAMCRFRAGGIYQQPVMQHFDYAMHLDTDSYFPDDVSADPLEIFHNGNYSYGYAYELLDAHSFLYDFWPLTLRYMANKAIDPRGTPLLTQFVTGIEYNIRTFMTDFEIINLRVFRPPSLYQDYFRYIDSADGFWLHRWGNNAVRTIAVSMFLEQNQVLKMKTLPYAHQCYCQCHGDRFCDEERRCNKSKSAMRFCLSKEEHRACDSTLKVFPKRC